MTVASSSASRPTATCSPTSTRSPPTSRPPSPNSSTARSSARSGTLAPPALQSLEVERELGDSVVLAAHLRPQPPSILLEQPDLKALRRELPRIVGLG